LFCGRRITRGTILGSAAPVRGRAMADVEHDHHMLAVIDLIQHSPVAAKAGAVDAGQFRAERLAYPARILQEGSGDELGCRADDLDG
jgi:hypothetical protein